MKNLHIPVIKQASATSLPYPDNYFDAVFTDPPVAQAIAEVLPEGDKEKQMLQGFLYGRETYKKEEVLIEKQKSFEFGKE
ncbi:MAG: hypothetical protein ACPL6D_03525 [Thermodesulfobacteriota bacterium]